MEKEVIIEQVKNAVTPVLEEMGIELVDLTFRKEGGRLMLRLLADKEGGITVDECAHINRYLSEVLDQKNIINQRYTLEVSSPGLDRPLITSKDFHRVIGRQVRIITSIPINNSSDYSGFVRAVDEEAVTIETKDGETIRVPLDKITKAKEVIEF